MVKEGDLILAETVTILLDETVPFLLDILRLSKPHVGLVAKASQIDGVATIVLLCAACVAVKGLESLAVLTFRVNAHHAHRVCRPQCIVKGLGGLRRRARCQVLHVLSKLLHAGGHERAIRLLVVEAWQLVADAPLAKVEDAVCPCLTRGILRV